MAEPLDSLTEAYTALVQEYRAGLAGLRPDYSWLHVPVLDGRGNLRHDRGIVAAPGLYVLGLPYMRRRKSSFMHGAGDDVRELGAHLVDYLDRTARPRAVGLGA